MCCRVCSAARTPPHKVRAGPHRRNTRTTTARPVLRQAKSIEHVTSIRVEADNLENDRRIEEENKRQDRLWRLQEEAVASGKANAAVEMRWNDLMEHNMPQDLNRVRGLS